MSTIQFIDTNHIKRHPAGEGAGEQAEAVGAGICGAQSARGLLRWLNAGERIDAKALPGSHQLLYLMEGEAVIRLDEKDYPAGAGAGLYLGPGEGAVVHHSGSAALKVFHLTVPPA